MHKLKDKEIYYLFSSAPYYLISWPEEGTFSIVASNKIISPPPDVLKPGTICKVKGLDKQQLCIDLLMVGSWSAKEQPGGSLDSIQDI